MMNTEKDQPCEQKLNVFRNYLLKAYAAYNEELKAKKKRVSISSDSKVHKRAIIKNGSSSSSSLSSYHVTPKARTMSIGDGNNITTFILQKHGKTMSTTQSSTVDIDCFNHQSKSPFVYQQPHQEGISNGSSFVSSDDDSYSDKLLRTGSSQDSLMLSSHNELEKNRRCFLRTCMEELRSEVASSNNNTTHKLTTLNILKSAKDQIRRYHSKNVMVSSNLAAFNREVDDWKARNDVLCQKRRKLQLKKGQLVEQQPAKGDKLQKNIASSDNSNTSGGGGGGIPFKQRNSNIHHDSGFTSPQNVY